MGLYKSYLDQIEERRELKLHPKPIDDGQLTSEIISIISDPKHNDRDTALEIFLYNILPGTTDAAVVKAEFLKSIICDQVSIKEISKDLAFELLSHMKGGPSIKVLLEIALGNEPTMAKKAAEVLKTQVFLYDSDTSRLKEAYINGNAIAHELLESFARGEFFTSLPAVENEIDVITYVAGEGDISTDLLSPGNQAHSRADRELHGKCFIS